MASGSCRASEFETRMELPIHTVQEVCLASPLNSSIRAALTVGLGFPAPLARSDFAVFMALPQLPLHVFLWKDGEAIHFKIKKNTQLKKLMDAYCARRVRTPTLCACVRFVRGRCVGACRFLLSRARVWGMAVETVCRMSTLAPSHFCSTASGLAPRRRP